MADLRLVSDREPSAVEKILAEHVSPIARAHNALRRVLVDPHEHPGLVREIAREIVEAEQTMLRGSVAIIRETFGNRS